MNSYTYEKLHVWKVTRIEYWVLIGALLYAYRFFHGTFDTRMFSNVKLFIRGTFGAFCPLRPTIHKGQWRWAFMFSLIWTWTNSWVNNRDARDLRRFRAHYDVTVMFQQHCSDVIMSAMASQITSVSIVYSSVCSGADQRKHQSFASLAFVRGIHRRPVIPLTKDQ